MDYNKLSPRLQQAMYEMCPHRHKDPSVWVGGLSKKEIFDQWLRYEGIIGYTDVIIEVLEGLCGNSGKDSSSG